MKRFVSVLLVLLMSALPAFAEGGRSFVVNTDSGAMLIDESGNALTAMGEYDVIDTISSEDCPAERRLFMVSQMDLSSGFFLEGEDEDEHSLDGGLLYGSDENWDSELDEVEEWPVDLEQLGDGFEMDVIDDVPVDWGETSDEYGDILDDEYDMLDDEYMDYGYDYGVALMNAKGELLTGFDYIGFSHDVANGVVEAYTFEGFVTMLDEQGNVLTEGLYISIVSDCSGGFFAVMPEIDPVTGDFSEIAPIVHITADGAIEQTGMRTFSYETLPGFSEGYMCVLVCDEENDTYKYVYIDVSGQPQFGAYFEYAANFMGGVAEVNDSDYQVHLIDTSGNYVTGEGYSYFDYYSVNTPIIGNLADGGFDLISRDDYSVIASFRPEGDESFFSAYNSGDGFILASSDVREMVIDPAGNVLWSGELVETRYIYTGYEYSDALPGRMLVTEIGENGNVTKVVDFGFNTCSGDYREIYPMSWAGGSGRYQAMDYDVVETEYYDEVIIEPDYETVVYGVIDQDGNVIVPVEHDFFMYLDHDRYWVGSGNQYRLIDCNGKVIAEFISE